MRRIDPGIKYGGRRGKILYQAECREEGREEKYGRVGCRTRKRCAADMTALPGISSYHDSERDWKSWVSVLSQSLKLKSDM